MIIYVYKLQVSHWPMLKTENTVKYCEKVRGNVYARRIENSDATAAISRVFFSRCVDLYVQCTFVPPGS